MVVTIHDTFLYGGLVAHTYIPKAIKQLASKTKH